MLSFTFIILKHKKELFKLKERFVWKSKEEGDRGYRVKGNGKKNKHK